MISDHVAIVPSPGAQTHDPVRRIAAFVRGFSLEATRPTEDEVHAIRAVLPAGTPVYLSAVPKRPPEEEIDGAVRLRNAGFEPVPHLAVRNFATAAALDDFLARMTNEAAVRRLLVIGGDRDEPAGPFRHAIEAIDSGVLRNRGIEEIGLAAYPDGHPRIPDHELQRALVAKIESAEQTGLGVHIVTQFCFDAKPILSRLDRLREFGIERPVRIGLAGPTNLATLVRYMRRCGVKASVEGLTRQAHLGRRLFGMTAPDQIVRPLAERCAQGEFGKVALHLFSFGGLAATARWAAAAAAAQFALDQEGGFQLDVP